MASNLETVTERLAAGKLESKPVVTFVNDTPAVAQLVNLLNRHLTAQPLIFIDLKGVNLSRHRNVSIIQVYYMPIKYTYSINIYIIGNKYFLTPRSNNHTLKDILKCNNITKVFFNIHNDLDTLYSSYQIKLAGIYNLQLMELATQSFLRRCINGLPKCIKRNTSLSVQKRSDWVQVKEARL
jgi:exonuclease 3'-5' domain-containing protein 1